jgi:hypothetical protein
MLDLSSSKWDDLHCAYGSGKNIPLLLHKLSSLISTGQLEFEQLFAEISNELCHQSTVGTASFAAVPHLIDLAQKLPFSSQVKFLILAANIEISRNFDPVIDVPEFLNTAYRKAHFQAQTMTLDCLKLELRRDQLQELLGAYAVFCGETMLGTGIFWSDEFDSCPKCFAEFPARGYRLLPQFKVQQDGIAEFLDSDEPFWDWQESNPFGFVVVLPTDLSMNDLALHRSGCALIMPDDAMRSIVCIPDKDRIWFWMRPRGLVFGETLKSCTTCHPTPTHLQRLDK